MSSLLSDPRAFIAFLIAIGIVLAAGIYLLYRKRVKNMRIAAAHSRPADRGMAGHGDHVAPPYPENPNPEKDGNSQAVAPKFTIFQKQSEPGIDLLRAILILLSLVVALALVLTLLPQSAVDSIEQYLQSRYSTAPPERIAFLYLGDQVLESQIRIRGAVRNITAMPLERLDAIVRFYARDRSLLETVIVRMDKETIAPNDIARFELLYPNNGPEFAGYSAEFKTRQGATVPFKDLRRLPVQSK